MLKLKFSYFNILLVDSYYSIDTIEFSFSYIYIYIYYTNIHIYIYIYIYNL